MKTDCSFSSIILAAGYGTRLRPLTELIPKPLLPLSDRTLLENILLNLETAGIAKFAVNTHHLGEILHESIKGSDWQEQITLFPEKEILGTGGPLVNAKEMLAGYDSFILHNGDILSDIDLRKLRDFHTESGAAVTMVLIDGPENKVSVDSAGKITDILGRLERAGNADTLMTYAGIACFSPAIFDYLPDFPENCSVITAILDMMREKPGSAAGYIPDKPFYWNDLGTVDKFTDAVRDIQTGAITLQPTRKDFRQIAMPLVPLPRQGSERLFMRFDGQGAKDESRIVMCSSADSADFERFCRIGKFLHQLNLGTPEIYTLNQTNHTVVMEDLGDAALFSIITDKPENQIENYYRKVLAYLVRLQAETCEKVTGETDDETGTDKLRLRFFDYKYLRWETEYFKENFLLGRCGIDKQSVSGLDEEFHTLAERCLSHPQVMIHRDFQSQNIIIQNTAVRIVDFQGARIGHIAYDPASLINDPYVFLPEKLRSSLISYYFELASAETKLARMLEGYDFEELYRAAAMQRGMQALGAYAFLSMKKKKYEYSRFFRPGLELLLETIRMNNDFPKIAAILDTAERSLGTSL